MFASALFAGIWGYFLSTSRDPQTPIGIIFTPLYCLIVFFTVCGTLASFRSVWLDSELPPDGQEMKTLYVVLALLPCMSFGAALVLFIIWSVNEVFADLK